MVSNKNCDDFPRSDGTDKTLRRSERTVVKRRSEQLFKKPSAKENTTKINEKKKKTRKNKKDKNKEDERTQEKDPTKNILNNVVIETMDIAKLPEGMLVYGCIEEIDDFELKFCITGGISVKVPITNISRSYTKLIEKFTNDDNEQNEESELAKLDTMFEIGDYFPLKIVNKCTGTHFGHTDIIASINPSDIYEGFSVKTLNTLPSGYPLFGAVSTIEDYGYGIDLGVDNVKAFLSFEECKKSQQKKLNIGQPVVCSIVRADERSITLTNNKKKIGTTLDFESPISISNFIPGTKTEVIITGVHRTGLELSLPGEYKGFVSKFHISNDHSLNDNKFNINDNVIGTVLYVQPHTKQVCISLKELPSKKYIKNFQNTYHFGMIIKNTTVCGKGHMGSIIFRLNGNNYAFCRRKHLAEASELEGMDLEKRFPTGSQQICKVKQLNLFDNLIEVSLKKSFIEKETLDVHDLSICQVIDCVIKKHDPKGIFVKLGPGIDGFVPLKHLTNAPFKNLNMEKMFPLKESFKCRIMKMDASSKGPRISLTMKKTLLNLPEEQIFKNFDDIRPGMSSTGVVCLIQQQGILVEFFSSVAAFIPLKNLATYKIEFPDKVFSVGQIVKVTIVSVNSQQRRMIGTLVDLKINQKTDQTYSNNAKLEIGQILKKMKIMENISKNGFDLISSDKTVKVFLPVGHLSDDPYLSQLLFMSLKPGDSLDQVMVFKKDATNHVIVTMKPVFIDYETSEDKKLIKREEDIELKVPFPVIVRNITDNGVFFEIPGGNCGVLRKKYFQDNFYDEPEKLGLKKNQTIFVCAVESLANFDDENENDPKKAQQLKRYKFSMKLSDVWNKKDDSKTDFMKNYLTNQSFMKKMLLQTSKKKKSNKEDKTVESNMRDLLNYSIGEIVKYTVSKIEETYLQVKIDNGTNSVIGFASKWNDDFNDFNVDQVGEAIVCDYDFEKDALRVFIQPGKGSIIKHAKNSYKNDKIYSNLKVNQVIKGTIISIGNKHLLVCLSDHASGVIVYVPSRRHYNDCGNIEGLFNIGNEHHFRITSIGDEHNIVAVLSIEAKSKANKEEKQKQTNKDKKDEIKKAKIEARRAEKKAKKAKLRNERRLNKLAKLGSKAADEDNVQNISKNGEFQWDIPNPTPNLAKKRKLTLDDIPDSESEHSSSDNPDSDDELNNNKPSKKRKTKAELSNERKERENQLREKEKSLTNPKRQLKTEQDYEMAVIAEPNSSMVWLKYMSFFIENGNINKAKEIAERALEKISFREGKEKLNIWIGLLNLENTYGDQDSMNSVLEKALKYNDPKNIYLQLASIYDLSDKYDKSDEIFQIMLKKFKQDKIVWIEYLVFLMKNNRVDLGRKQFQKSLLSLNKRDHVDVISKFAQLEFKFGDVEQAKTIFEQMLATYWKRLDQWSIYIDMLIKYTINQNNKDTIEYIRNIFERLISLKYSPERMKFIFKKYYDFEEKYNPDNVEVLDRIKQKALEFVEKDIF